jgi:CxxC motif-containing protein (DUF1111 family)
MVSRTACGYRYELLDLAFGRRGPRNLRASRPSASASRRSTKRASSPWPTKTCADGDGVSGAPIAFRPPAEKAVLGDSAEGQPADDRAAERRRLLDIGITSTLFPDADCPEPQTECRDAPSGGEPEVDDLKLERVAFYTHLLAVPARRDIDDATVRRGEQLFGSIGCAACHVGTFTTGELGGHPELSHQTIHPYTDLLLHDMGAGLADHRPDFAADGFEWRTPPLWGIGLVETVNQHSFFLHDGRARGLAEAILWHGGEGEASRERFRMLAAADREALIRFLESL